MLIRTLTASLLVLFLAACASDGGTKPQASNTRSADQVAQTNDDDPNRIICRNEKKVGSHFRTKRCRTVAEIQAEREDARRAMQNMGSGMTGPNDG